MLYTVFHFNTTMYMELNAQKEEFMSHNFPCTPGGGKISQLNPTCTVVKDY